MTITTTPGGERNPALIWDFMRLGIAQRFATLAVFGLLYAALVLFGYDLRENADELAINWPAAGLLFMALYYAPRRNWIWILAVQVPVEIAVHYLRFGAFNGWTVLFAVADSIDAIVGALVARRLIAIPEIPQIEKVVQLLAAVALGSVASAVLGALGSANIGPGNNAAHLLPPSNYLREWQLWWAGNWLGSLSVAPVVMTWAVRWRVPKFSAPPPPTVELALIGCALLGMTIWVFSATPGSVTTILGQPFMLLALVGVAAFRLPPRWSTTLVAMAVIIASYFAAHGSGPFAGDPNPFVRVGGVQLYLATLIIVNFLLAIVLLETRQTLRLLRASGDRYQNFVEQSSEAMWRIELKLPMDPALAADRQTAWLREHAYVAECNRVYRHLNRQFGVTEAEASVWRIDAPWAAIYLAHLQAAAQQNYSIDGLQFTVTADSRQSTYITGFRGVIEGGKLARIWGVARDVTELVELNDRLRRNQDRLQMYARQLAGAEERARRATAVDLHDGIGQQLVGLAMTLSAAASRAPPEVRLLLGEATHTLREVQGITQRVIADLSPPGLYELGLEPALQWLSVYMRGRDNLQVDLQVAVQDAAFNLDLRVLVFKLIRELLRNVVKHSGVQAAAVAVSQTPQELRVTVADRGGGFEWQLSLFEPRAKGFGLWSVADRVRAAAGEMTVDTAPGHGCRVTVVFPLRAAIQPNGLKDYRAAADG